MDKYIGDAVMLLFGATEPDPEHAFHAVATAVLLRRVIEHVSRRRQEEGLRTVRFKMSVNTGPMLAGNMGSAEHMQFTVVGDAVNLASRICGMADPGQIVISQAVCHDAGVRKQIVYRRHQTMRLRGVKLPTMTYTVNNLGRAYRDDLDAFVAELFEEDHRAD